jgi:hypothetical protein
VRRFESLDLVVKKRALGRPRLMPNGNNPAIVALAASSQEEREK